MGQTPVIPRVYGFLGQKHKMLWCPIRILTGHPQYSILKKKKVLFER